MNQQKPNKEDDEREIYIRKLEMTNQHLEMQLKRYMALTKNIVNKNVEMMTKNNVSY